MMIYEKKYDLRVSDFDKNDNMRPFGVLDLFQTVADKHASILKIGFNELIAEDLVWVLLRTRYDVINPIGFGESEVTVKTWPHKAGRVDFDRDYQIDKADGRVGIIASSKWCIINVKTRKIVFGKGVSYPEDEYYPQVNYPDGLKKLADFDILSAEKKEGFAGESALDHNGHVNNAKYAEFILDAVPLLDGEKIKSFEINYINEMQVGNYQLYFKKEGNKRLIKGFFGEKESFRAEIETF
ncbi:MAG: hypothetical protein E7360_01940 [Clostridiales bacterium]|nr:hypothetical protein [Clostridiales bacterium]